MSKTKVAEKPVARVQSDSREFNVGGKKMIIKNEDLICSFLLLVLVMIVHGIRSNFLTIPFERDEGIYSYFGTLVLEGKTPYKDFYEVKFPGLFYFYGLMVGLFGDTVKGIHTGFMYLNLASMVLIYFSARNLFSPVAGLISAATFAFVSLTPNLSGFTVQAEHGVAFFIALGFLFYSLAKNSGKWYFYLLMGIAMGGAVMVKTSGVFLAFWGAVVVVSDFIFTKQRVAKTFWINSISYAGGGLLIIGAMFLVILMKGSFKEMIFWAYEHPKQYVSNMPFEEGVKYFKYTRDAIIQNHKLFWFHGIAAIGLILLRPVDFKLKVLGVTLLAFSFMTIVPGFYFYGHYWIQTVPGLALVAGLTCHAVLAILKAYFNLGHVRYRYIYLGIFGFLTFNHVTALKSYYYHPNYERILRAVYGNNPFPESMEVANYINANSKPEDNIVLLGSEPQIYFYTKKKSPSRHAYFTSIVNNIPEHKEWQREFARDTEKAKPKFVIFFNHPLSLLVQPNTDKYVFEWANEFITKNYKLVGLVDMIEGQTSTYVWKEALNTYKPVSQNLIYVYERVEVAPQAVTPQQP